MSNPGPNTQSTQNLVPVNVALNPDGTPSSAFTGNGNTLNLAQLTTTPSGGVAIVGSVETKINPGGQTLAVLGDSISNQNIATDDFSENGFAVWASVLSNGGLVFSPSLNFGVSGDTTTQMLARISSVVAAAPSYCTVLGGTNDLGTGAGDATVSYATITGNLQTIYTTLLNAGICVIAIPILPKAGLNLSTTKTALLNRVNEWIRRYCMSSTSNIVLADPFESLVDYTKTTGEPIGGYAGGVTSVTVDGTHPNKRGGYLFGKTIVDALGSRIAPMRTIMQSPADAYDATYNPTGNLLANGMFSGTAGTNSTGSSGSVGGSWTASRAGGTTGTIVASKTSKTLSNGQTVPQQTLVVTAPAGSSIETLGLTSASITTGFTAGVDTIYGELEVGVSGITADSVIGVEYTIGDGTNTIVCLAKQTNTYMANQSWSGVLRTPEFLIAAAATSLYARFRIYIDGTVSSAGATVQLGRATVRKV